MSSIVFVICLLAMKPVWSWWMKGLVRLQSCSHLATIVERSLRSVFDRVMGRRLVMMVWSWFFFGIRMVCVSFQVVGGVSPVETWLKTVARIGAKRSLKCW